MLLYNHRKEIRKQKREGVKNMKSGYKMSMIRKNGTTDYFGEFETKEFALEMAEDFKALDSDYVDCKIWYFEK